MPTRRFIRRRDLAGYRQRFLRLLTAMAEPERPIGALEILERPERETILRVWNDTDRAIAPSMMPALLAAQAARTPDAVALVFEDRSVSYAELEADTNRLAHHLRGLGVRPETVVGLCVERSPEMVIGLLGIFTAGGACLPLDPSYPRDRLAFMLRRFWRRRAGDGIGATAAAAPAVDRAIDRGSERGGDRGRRPRCALPYRPARHRLAAGGAAAGQRSRIRARPTPPRLCHLHLGVNRNAKRRRRRARQPCQQDSNVGREVWNWTRLPNALSYPRFRSTLR